MIRAPVQGRLGELLRSLRTLRVRVAPTNEREVVTATETASFTWPVLIFFVGVVVITFVQMWLAIRARYLSPILPAAIYTAGITIAVWSRASKRLLGILGLAGIAIALCILLDVMTQSDWGNIGLYIVIATVVYRLPPRLSMPITVLASLIILASEGLFDLLLGRGASNGGPIISQALIIGFAFAASLAQRMRHLLIERLERTQEQLREEMGRAAELAAARERARIARDVHDVLAHSLTVLSVQVQALRQLIRDNPERAAALLDQMAEVLRESQVESRQIVGLLREASVAEPDDADLATRLRVVAERFAERTGMQCTLREHGAPGRLPARHAETLRLAVQEALTNAYRHGNAAHAVANLWWEPDAVRLVVSNDGVNAPSNTTHAGTGQGLRGMRERAESLGGTAQAEPQAGGGYVVSVTLPLNAAPDEQTMELACATMVEESGKPGEASV